MFASCDFFSLILHVHSFHVVLSSYLRAYLDRTISLSLNKNRKVVGTLRGYDQFMNVVLENAIDKTPSNASEENVGTLVIRGNNILQFELVS